MPTPELLYREIPLTNGHFAKVDEADFDRLGVWKWQARYSSHTRTFYATRTERLSTGKRITVLMHREVLGLKKGDGLHGDHINGDTLDNRRINLRVVTNLQNSYNQKIAKNNTTGFKGVVRRRNGWECYIQAEGKKKYLGFSPTKEGAGELYRVASLDLHGEFARTQ